MKQVLITINGPGEISAWLTPLSKAIKARDPDIRLFVCLLPCAFSAGSERAVLDRMETVDGAASTAQSLKMLALKSLPDGFEPNSETLLVHLGGDITLSSWLARRFNLPAFAYTEYPSPVLKHFERIFYNGLVPMPATIDGKPTEPIGEMMVDAAFAKRGGLDAPHVTGNVVGVFPGSRAYMAEFMLPYFAPAIDAVAKKRPDVRWMMAASDFVDANWLERLPAPPEDRNWTASALSFHADPDAPWFETEGGTRIDVRPNPEVFREMKLALTIPGTNTGEMAAAGIPMVAVLPTYDYVIEAVPLPGPANYLSKLPWLGSAIKHAAASKSLARQKFLSQANRRADREITPELIGQNLHGEIEKAVLKLLDDKTGAISAEIQSIMGAPGTAERFADAVVDHFV